MKKKYQVTPVNEISNSTKPCFKKRTIKNLKDNYIRALQIFVLLVTIGVTEGGLNHLYAHGIKWPRETYVAVIDVHRAVLWLALTTSCVMFKFMLDRPLEHQKKWTGDSLCPVCGRNKSEEYFDARCYLKSRMKRKKEIRKFDIVELVHSVLFTLSFLNCSIMMIGTIPHKYHSSLEVYLKMIGVLCDLILALLFTKTSIDTYELKFAKEECNCMFEHVYEENYYNTIAQYDDHYQIDGEKIQFDNNKNLKYPGKVVIDIPRDYLHQVS